jgi:hypothetical protein
MEDVAKLNRGEKIDKKVKAITNNNVVLRQWRRRINLAMTNQLTSLEQLVITHEQLGTGATAPTELDTTLETPEATTKKLISSVQVNNSELDITSFYPEGTARGTWNEYGIFANTNFLIIRLALDSVEVGALDALTITGKLKQNI